MKKTKQIYIVGIGGVGVSALARLLQARGDIVRGSDFAGSEIAESLRNDGIDVVIGHGPDNISADIDELIYSLAVSKDNPERIRAGQFKIPQISYPSALGALARDYKVIAVAGTNGKTTTTAMIACLLESQGFDPTVVVGSMVNDWHSNARLGTSKYLVLEADEYRRAFLNYHPDIAVVTNIEPDHLDYYRDISDIKSAFREFVSQIKPGGTLIYNQDNPNARELGEAFLGLKIPFSNNASKFSLHLQLPGKYNRENALATVAVGKLLGIEDQTMLSSLASFAGTWRRFQLVGMAGHVQIISDYAHHPDGLRALFDGINEKYPDKKILMVFQPHQHNRTKKLFYDFVKVISESMISDFIIPEIFEVHGRESVFDLRISSRDLVKAISTSGKNCEYSANLTETESMVRQKLNAYNVIIFAGAGDIYKIAEKLVN